MFRKDWVLVGITISFLVGLQMPGVRSDCCLEGMKIIYKTPNGTCGMTGGYRSMDNDDECNIKICADGEPISDTYCGKKKCNMFGCNCVGGCIDGNWEESFLERNKKYNVMHIAKIRIHLMVFKLP